MFSDESGGNIFGLRIEDITAHDKVAFDAMIVATLDNPTAVMHALDGLGIAREKLVLLREAVAA